ncbi:MAG: hypothetical protein GX638_17245 [Crenarchaeota archaeon]|nr:hypothetical protein [Thermoproteota archaeon]
MITPAAGKRLIAKAMLKHKAVNSALKKGTLVIIAGTTNGYIAQEILKKINAANDFSFNHFFRGVILPPTKNVNEQGRVVDESQFPGDVVIVNGVWQKGKTIFDVIDNLKEGDVILKGANAVNLQNNQAGILIGHPKSGTIGVALQVVMGKRVELIIPVGLEKRVFVDLNVLSNKINAPGAHGYRLFPISGNIITELEAIFLLTNTHAEIISAGGIGGAEGSCLLAVSGTEEEENNAEKLITEIANEPAFRI